jgi:Fe-S oxidoreductase
MASVSPYVERGVPVLGLEPSCLFSFRDEFPAMLKSDRTARLASRSFLIDEFLARETEDGLTLPLKPLARRALLHGHCHQKAFGALGATEALLRLVPELEVETIESSCCGMAGSFGYAADTIDVSLQMAELSLLPAVRRADANAIVVADGTSCRHQIQDGTAREAVHAIRVLAASLGASEARL